MGLPKGHKRMKKIREEIAAKEAVCNGTPMYDLGFRVVGFGFRVCGYMVLGLGFGVTGFGV